MTPEDYYHLTATEVDYSQPMGQAMALHPSMTKAVPQSALDRRLRIAKDRWDGMFLNDIAIKYDISRERCRQILVKFYQDYHHHMRAAHRRLYGQWFGPRCYTAEAYGEIPCKVNRFGYEPWGDGLLEEVLV